MDTPLVHLLVWLRVPGDSLFAVGAALVSVFVASLWLAAGRRPVVVTQAVRDSR
jgi:nitric oxide reductase subunit B